MLGAGGSLLAVRTAARLRNCARDHPLPRPNSAKLAPKIPGVSNELAGPGPFSGRANRLARRRRVVVRSAS
jgi:hypothetical protein